MSTFVRHLPHIVPIVAGFVVVVWLWMGDAKARRERAAAEAPRAAPVEPPAPPREVRASTARRGLVVLGPILAALATGAVIYGIDLGAGSPSRGLAWTHTGVSVLVCLLAVYKLAGVPWAAIRQGWSLGRALEVIGSAAVAVLLVPLLVTGVALLVAPSDSSAWAYVHLIASAWWTVLVLWHLRRYLAPALRARRRGAVPKTWSQSGELTP